MSEEKQYSLDEDDDYNECLLDPNNDRRTIICDSHNKADGIIQCIGSIESQYIPDEKAQQREKTHGTGTVIHIDNQNNIYVLTSAHNILAMERECQACKTKTLKTECQACKKKTKKTKNLIKPTHMFFSRRGHGIKHILGQSVERYQIEEYKLPNEYSKFPTPHGGYDIAILIIKCHDKNGIDLYSKNCLNICLINDETFGGNQNILNIYGFPGEKRTEKNHRVYYYLFGMSGSKLDNTNKFNIAKHEQTNKFYVVNKGIDTTHGQSGSCIYSYSANNKNKYLIYAVHSGGSPKKRVNFATFLDINNIEWIANVLAQNDMYLQNMISNKFVPCHYRLVLSRELHKQNIYISSEKEKELVGKLGKEKQRTQQLEVEVKNMKSLIEEIMNKNEEKNIEEKSKENIQQINRLIYYNPQKNQVAVTIQSKYHGQYWRADNKNENQCFCSSKKIGLCEVFWSYSKGGNIVAFKSHHGKWVQIKQHLDGQGIHALGEHVKTWELFQLVVVNAKQNEYAIKCDNKKFISSREWGLNASKDNKGATEVFIIQPLHE